MALSFFKRRKRGKKSADGGRSLHLNGRIQHGEINAEAKRRFREVRSLDQA
jgi:hypothetical protein